MVDIKRLTLSTPTIIPYELVNIKLNHYLDKYIANAYFS